MRARRRTRNIAESHRDWLHLVDTDGPFIAVPALMRAYPDGMPRLREDSAGYAALSDAKPTFDRSWDSWASAPGDETREAYRVARDAWVGTVFRDVLHWGRDFEEYDEDRHPDAAARSGDLRYRDAPTHIISDHDGPQMLIAVTDPVAGSRALRAPSQDGWAASPIERMEMMLSRSDVPLGLVTDGRWWGLVSVPVEGGLPASGVVDAQTWIEEEPVRDGFLALISPERVVGAAKGLDLPQLFVDSVAAAESITEALGSQVRQAVELLVQSMSESGVRSLERHEKDPLPDDDDEVYEAAVTAMMRVVFLLFAEERGMVPQGPLFASSYGISGQLNRLESRAAVEGEEAMDGTSRAWHRLLATSRAFFDGATFEDMRLPAYGGSLFQPQRFPWLESVNEHGELRLRISDRVMLHALRSVQYADLGSADTRRISFREIDVEQIGYIYEGLLGFTTARVEEIVVGLQGPKGHEPSVPLVELERLASDHEDPKSLATAVRGWVKENQVSAKPPTPAALTRQLDAGVDDADAERRLLPVSADTAIRRRLRPWIGIIRDDLRGRAAITMPGGLVVVETPSRATSGAHYTPRSLAEEVVEHALEPVVYQPGPRETEDRNKWRPLSSDDILELKVVDIACGSGAFLVAAARYLAKKLVESWHEEGATPPGSSADDLHITALREVVAHCLYGADINPMAIEMCKLSLWLVSLDRERPFSFVDDKVLCGNSLLGLTRMEQLLNRDIYSTGESGQTSFGFSREGDVAQLDLERDLREAARIRRALATPVEEGLMRNRRAKEGQLNRSQKKASTAHLVADGTVAAGLQLGGRPGRRLDDARTALDNTVARAFPTRGTPNTEPLESLIDVGLTPEVDTDYHRWPTLHWPVALSDVIHDGPDSGFDAVIGNPPFLGGQKLTGAMGTNVRDWFVHAIAGGRRGSADLVAYFFLRALDLLKPTGTVGLIATNTVAQGDTREVGLDQMVSRGFTITRSIQSRAWPASGANLEYAAVWGTLAPVADGVRPIVDDNPVPRVSTLLEPTGRVEGHPQRLAENSWVAFQGCIVLGRGFVLEPDEAQAWIDEDPRNAEVLFPYLNGEDLNSRPDSSPSRWVIDFYDRSEDDAATYAAPFDRVKTLVEPERLSNNRKALRERWWQYAEKRPGMRQAISRLDEVLVIALVSKTVMPMRRPNDAIFSHALGVFATDSYADQAVLSSSIHQMWVANRSSSLETRVRYTPSDVFDTFPRPYNTDGLHDIGRRLDVDRREIMIRRELGVTKLYNLVNDPEIDDYDADVAHMRALHAELDRAVASAYGWDDLAIHHGFHTYRQMTRWTVDELTRVEILDRLLEENHRRAQLELENGGLLVRPPRHDHDTTREKA